MVSMSKELDLITKKSLYSFKVNSNLKDQVVQSYLNELSKIVKSEVKRKNLVILVSEEK